MSTVNTEGRILQERDVKLTISDKTFENHLYLWLAILAAHRTHLGEFFKINAQLCA